jgi:hypothetical protein
MKRNVKLFALVGLAILAGLVLKSNRGHGQGGQQSPIIIKRVFLRNQTGAIGPVTLFTPTTEGLYRISTYADVAPPSNGAAVCGSISWTDDFSANTIEPIWNGQGGEDTCPEYGSNGYGTNVFVIHAAPNQPVTFYTFVGGPGPISYTVILTVEQL